MKRSALGAIALGVAGAAVAGYGAAIGRDAWHASKKNAGSIFVIIVVLALLTVPFMGGRNLTRGYAGAAWGSYAGGMILVALGVAAPPAFVQWVSAGQAGSIATLGVGFLAVGVAIIGAFVGLMQRPKRKRTFAVANHNERFLDARGIIETGESEISHRDGDGSALRVMERTEDAIVFMAVGKRNKRAYIQLARDGKMIGYTGVIGLGDERVYT